MSKTNVDQLPTLISSIRQISGENSQVIYVPAFSAELVADDKNIRAAAWAKVGADYPEFLIPVAELVQREYLNEAGEADFGKLAALQTDEAGYVSCENQQLLNIAGAVFKGVNNQFDLGANNIESTSSDEDFVVASQMYFEELFNAHVPEVVETTETVVDEVQAIELHAETLPAPVESFLPSTHASNAFISFIGLYTANQAELLSQVSDMLNIASALVKSQAQNAEKLNEALKTMIPAEVLEKA